MSRIYNVLIELVAAAVFIIPVWCIYEKFFLQPFVSTWLWEILL